MGNERLVSAATLTVAACAVIMTSVSTWSHLRVTRPSSRTAEIETTVVEDWQGIAAAGTFLGSPDAPVIITEFTDYQCPYCRRLHENLQALQTKYGSQFSVSVRHYPIERIHPEAKGAALALECSAQSGKASAMNDLLYSLQDSSGAIAWEKIGHRLGMEDTSGFALCVAEGRHAERIRRDMDAAEQLGIRGTPMLLINNRLIRGSPPQAVLDSLMRLSLAEVPR